jgi:YHS domain-containing protein
MRIITRRSNVRFVEIPMTKSMCALLCAICIGLGVAGTVLRAADSKPTTQPASTQPTASATPVNTKCPVSGEDIDASRTIVYKGKTIAFCCPDCEEAFNKDPEKYVAKMK